jgi:hypothetical protein
VVVTTLGAEALKIAPTLSIRQPWAELIVSGRKTIELRTWPVAHRGLIWIHAGGRTDPELEGRFGCHVLYHGGVIGLANIRAVVPMDRERWELWRTSHLDPGPFVAGMYAWVLSEPVRLNSPLALPGRLKLFQLGDEVVGELLRLNPGLGEEPTPGGP